MTDVSSILRPGRPKSVISEDICRQFTDIGNMANGSSGSNSSKRDELLSRGQLRRISAFCLTSLMAIASLSGVVAAHGGELTPNIPQWYGLVILLLGLGVVGGAVVLNRRDQLSSTEHALAGIFVGVLVAALGGIMIVQLSPIDEYSASSMPFPRSWYTPITLGVGLSIIVASVFLGQFRWPKRPRYSVLGGLLGLWVAYPALVQGTATYTHPLGYLIVLAVPITVTYIIWRDGRQVLTAIWQDSISRRFGLGIGAVMLLFFVFSTGLVSLVPEDGLINGHGVMETSSYIATQPFASPLVLWPAVQVWLPQIPLSAGISLGVVLMIALLGSLVAMNAMLAAFQWMYANEGSSGQSTAGAAALVGPNACGCCGPMFAQLAVVLIGPSAAAPLYWLFVDFSSPVGSFFFVASVGLLTGGFVYSANALSLEQCTVPSQPRSPSTEKIESAD